MKKNKPFILASGAPCLHCGSPFNSLACHGSARLDGTVFNVVFQVVCMKCRSSGPLGKTVPEAIKGWEHRAEPCFDEPLPELPELEFQEAEAG